MAPDTPRPRYASFVPDGLTQIQTPDPGRCDAEPRPPSPKPPTERGWWEDSAWSEYKSAFWDDNGAPDATREVDRTFENEVRPR